MRVILLATTLGLVVPLVAPRVAPLSAQQLRHGIADAAIVVIAEPLGSSAAGEHLVAHRFRVIEAIKGEATGEIVVLEATDVADAPAPRGTGRRLLCLVADHRRDPPEGGPFLRATGYPGEDPTLGANIASAHILELARTLVASELGAEPARIADVFVRLTLEGRGIAQREAAEVLRERDVLRSHVSQVDIDQMLSRAVAETNDVELKIALASLCAEARPSGVVEALCGALMQCRDERFALAIGRIARHVHGEDANAVLQRFLRQARGPLHDSLLLALGATKTESALTYLLEIRRQRGAGQAVDAALRAHGAVRAIDAIEPPKTGEKK